MFNLSEIFTKAFDGQGLETMAQQFALSPEQTKAAIEALLPAFSAGLNHAAKSAPKMADVFGMFTTNSPFAKAYEKPADAFSYESIYAGTEALKKIFGSDAAAQSMAQQAAKLTGLQPELMQRMMAPLSSVLMGGIFKEGVAGQNPLVAMTAQLSKAGLMPQAWIEANPFNGYFAQLFDLFERVNRPHSSNPFAVVQGMEHISYMARQAMAISPMLELNPFLKAVSGGVDPGVLFGNFAEGDAPKADVTLGQQAADAWSRTFGEVFSAGLKQSDDYLKALEQALPK